MMNTFRYVLAACLTATCSLAAAQGAIGTPVGVLTSPCNVVPSPPREVTKFVEAMQRARDAGQSLPVPSPEATAAYEQYQKLLLMLDFSNLCRYEKANAELGSPTAHRMVFFGDSITEEWKEARPAFFFNDRLDRGISGQTTAQMIGRFYTDVILLRPKIVHILAGANDIAGNTGPTSVVRIENNIRAMTDLAKAHGIKVVLGTLLPTLRYNWRPAIDPKPSILELNRWIRAYASAERFTLIDYYALLDNGKGGLSAVDSEDGVHPTKVAYEKMEAALGRALPLR